MSDDVATRGQEAAARWQATQNGNGQVVPIGDWVTDVDAAAEPTLEELEQDFWESREYLSIIYQASLARLGSPWAVLACVVARVLCLVPPSIVLPDIIGGVGSLNWAAAIVAESGKGKGTANAIARDLIDADINVCGIGSGEGMIECYRRGGKVKDDVAPVVSVLFSMDEIDSLGAQAGRSGQTTLPILRQGFNGETLGYSYRGRASERVGAHSYRMVVLASVQPERAGVLFDNAAGGTPQRFMWFPAYDKRLEGLTRLTKPPFPTFDDGSPRVLPIISASDLGRSAGKVSIPEEAEDTIIAAHTSGSGNGLDGHALFSREKFAFALAFLDGSTDIDSEDWRLSGIAANVSDWMRAKALRKYQQGKQQLARERGVERGIEQYSADLERGQQYQKDLQRVARSVLQKIAVEPMTRTAINRKTSSYSKSGRLLDAAMEWLVDNGLAAWDGDRLTRLI